MFSSVVPFLFPLLLLILVIFMSIKEYKNYKETTGDMPEKVKLIRRFIGYSAMVITCLAIIAGLQELSLKKVTLWPWITIIAFLAITIFVGAWDAASEMRMIRKDMKKDCEEEIQELLQEYEKKAKEKKDESLTS